MAVTESSAVFDQGAPVSVRMEVVHNRPVIAVTLTGPGGTRDVRSVVDTGGGAFIITDAVAETLDLRMGAEVGEGDLRHVEAPTAQIGSAQLRLSEGRIMASPRGALAEMKAPGLVPGNTLVGYAVTFDYPGRRFELHQPGPGRPESHAGDGALVETPVHPGSRFPRVEVEIEGEVLGFLIDTGASFSMMSSPVMDRLRKAHPSWPAMQCAIGAACMGIAQEPQYEMLRVPRFRMGPVSIANAAFVSRPEGTFESWMSSMMTAPVVGALAGNVFRHARCTVDYSAETTSFTPISLDAGGDTDIVGISVALRDGAWRVTGAVGGAAEILRPGDWILEVAGQPADDLGLGELIDLLRGEPGSAITVVLERMGNRLAVIAPVQRFLA